MKQSVMRLAMAMAVMAPFRTMALGPAPVDLGAATDFAILAGSAITSTGGGDIYGDVGLSPGGGSSIGVIQTQTHGVIYAVDALGPVGSVMDPDLLIAAKNDLTAAYNDAAARTPVPSGPFLNPGAGNLGGLNVVPGLYKFTEGALISSDVTLTGGPDDVWIFQIATTLTVGSAVHVILAGGASARNIFWQVGSSATLDTFCDFKGTIMADQSITMNTSCTVEGRALARVAMVTFDGARINLPSAAPYNAGGRVWLDEDADAVQDAGEAGIANVVMQLLDTNSVAIAETVTDIEGRYLFAGLDAGVYTVRVDTTSMSAGLAANQTYDPDATLDHQTDVSLSWDDPVTTADFGYNWAPSGAVQGGTGTGAIGDRIWIDADGDGRQDPGEPGLAGVEVVLFVDSNSDGTYDLAVATNTTDAAGNYIFDDLEPDAYVVVVNDGITPAGYTATGDPDGVFDNRTTLPIILAPGDVYVNADFGYQPGASSAISGTVYFDAGANANLDGVDYGLAGVTVALLDTNGMVIATTTTATNGMYQFTGLPVGTNTVWVNDTANLLGGLAQTEDPDAVRDGRYTVTVNGVNAVTAVDFGYTHAVHAPGDGLIGDTIFLDRDGDGLFDPGEGLQGVVVNLYAADGTTLLASTLTDANGNYGFGGLVDGNYEIHADTTTLPNGGTGLTHTVDPDTLSPGDNESAVTISGGNIEIDQDFGYQALTDPNTIGGTMWEDINGNGLLDVSETNGLAGITVALTDTNGNVLGTTVTDADGNYGFSGLPDGTYLVDVTDEANLINGWWHTTGPTSGVDNNSQSDPYTVTVSGGQTDTTADFGYWIVPAALGNRVWLDGNGNGIQETGEGGLGGATVRLTVVYSGGITTTVAAVSQANGYYSFGYLLLDESYTEATAPVTYTLRLSGVPEGYYPVPKYQGGNGWLDSEPVTGVTVMPQRGYADTGLQTPPTLEPFNASFDFGVSPVVTLAVVVDFRAVWRDARAWVQWRTGAEIGTLGYWLERQTPAGWVAVNARMLPAKIAQPLPRSYELADAGADAGGTYTYRLVELENTGQRLIHGPYTITVDGDGYGYAVWAQGIAWGGAAAGRGDDPDGDRLTNFEEFLAGTDPLARDSVLRITHMRVRDGMVVLSWRSVEGRVYAVEAGPRPNGPFLPVAAGLPSTPPVNSFACPLGADREPMYYRVIVSEP